MMKKLFLFSMLCLMIAFGFGPAVQAQSDCVITTLPFTEGFETGSLGSCFSRNPLAVMPNGNLYPQVTSGGMYAPSHSGDYHLMSYNYMYSDTAAQVPCLIFPELSASFNMSDMVLDFWGWVNSANGYFVVGVMDDPEDMSTFTPVQTIIPTNTNSTYEHYTTYFSNYTGTGQHIALKLAVTAYCMIRVDDISLSQAAGCPPVQYPTVADIMGTDVTISWQTNSLGTASAYNLTLVDLTNDSEVLSTTTADTFFTFTNLDFSTDYRAFITVTCSDNQVSPADSVDFSTSAPTATFPYFEDFEGDTSVALAPYTFTGAGPNQWVYGSAAGLPAADGPTGTGHSIYISPDSGATNVYTNTISDAYAVFNVIFPQEELEYHISFDYRVEGEASDYMEFDYLKVYMLNAGTDIPTSGEPSGVALLHNLGEVANVPNWTHFDIILNNVAGTSKQIVFYWYNNGWNLYGDNHLAAAIDNITVNGVACAQPNGLAASDITTDGATLSWNEAGSATSWYVYYRPEGSTAPYTETSVSGIPTVDIYNLTANTQYEFYVVSDCGSELSNPSAIASFRTDCGPIVQLPYSEGFENGLYATSQDTYIACWDRLTSDSSHYAYVGDASWNAHSGDHFLDFHYTPNCHVIAVMPELDQTLDASDLLLTFYACHTNYGYATLGTLEVGVMTDKTNDSTFVVIDTIDIAALSGYTYEAQMVSFVNYTGTGKYIAFRVSNSDGCGYYIDDLVLDVRPDCMQPQDFVAVSVTSDSVTLAWNELGTATNWNVQYGAQGFQPGDANATLVVVNENPCTIGGLANFTAYDFYVQSNCGESSSEWTGPLPVITGAYNIGTIGSDSLVTCQAIVCDNGGFNGDYSTYCDYMLTIYPATAGNGLQITGISDLSLGSYGYGESHLYFHDGIGTGTPVIADITGVNNNIAVAASGPITLHFTAGYYTGAGFILNVSCISCTPPSNVTATDIQNNQISLSWSGNADQYAVYMTGTENGYYTTTDTTITITGLTSDAGYTFQVGSVCGTDSSLLSPALSLTTTCDPVTITVANPWTEDFETYVGSGNTPFVCWARPVVDATYGSPFVYCGWAPSCHSGVNSAELKGSNAMLVLPAFTNDVHELRLNFWATSTNTSSGTLEVGVMTNFNDPATFELVGTCGAPGPRGTDSTGNGNEMGPFDFSNVTATNGRIALRYSNSSSWESWNLDDFVVEIIPAGCNMPTGLTVTNITQTSATATWTAGGDETAWKLQYRQAGTTDWGSEISVTTTSYDITGLTAETVYQVRVKADCGDGAESGWTNAYDFFTAQLPVIMPTVETYAATDITQTSGTMNGAITDEGNQTIILRGFEWKLTTDDNYAQVVTMGGNTLTFTLTGLTPNTCVQYRAYATAVGGTVYGETMTFCTTGDTPNPCATPTNLVATNVTDHSITFSWTDNADAYAWKAAWRCGGILYGPVTISSNPYTIENLDPDTTYIINIQAICAGEGESDWSEPLYVHTLGTGIANRLQNSISLYPNPAKEYIDVRVDELHVTGMEVYDVYGKLINTVNVVDNPTRINVSGLASGMYFVRVTTEQGVVTKSFVKK